MKLITYILCYIVLFCPILSSAQNEEIVIKRDLNNKRAIFKRDGQSGRSKVIYLSQKDLVINAKVSPNNEYISLIEIEKGTYKKENEWISVYKTPPRNSLTIIDPDGNIIHHLDDDVREYVWSPDGNYIAYITGTYSEDREVANFTYTGFYILNIDTKEKIAIENRDQAYNLRWVKTDKENSIYIRTFSRETDKRVLRYDMLTKQFGPTNTQGIDYSPDGEYYAVYSYEAIYLADNCDKPVCVWVYESKSNQLLEKISSGLLGNPVGWVYNKSHLFMFTKQEWSRQEKEVQRGGKTYTVSIFKDIIKSVNLVYDVETEKQIQLFEGKVAISNKWGEWVGNPNVVVIEEIDKNIHKRSYNKENKITLQKIPAQYKVK